jgi:hypothetical protein
MTTVGCGISHKVQNLQINTATTKQKQHRNKMMKPQTNAFFKNTVKITYKKSLI